MEIKSGDTESITLTIIEENKNFSINKFRLACSKSRRWIPQNIPRRDTLNFEERIIGQYTNIRDSSKWHWDFWILKQLEGRNNFSILDDLYIRDREPKWSVQTLISNSYRRYLWFPRGISSTIIRPDRRVFGQRGDNHDGLCPSVSFQLRFEAKAAKRVRDSIHHKAERLWRRRFERVGYFYI